MVDLGPLDELVTSRRRRDARAVIRRHDPVLAIRLDRYDPIPERLADAYLANMLDVLEEKRLIEPLRPSPMETERR